MMLYKVILSNISNYDQNRNKLFLTTFLNPFSYLKSRENANLLSSFNLHIDGIMLVLLLKILTFKNIKRYSMDMSSLIPIVFTHAINNGLSVYFIGTKEEFISPTINNIKKRFENLIINGYRHGFFKDKEEREGVLTLIKSQDPDIVICGMGTPLQEQFLYDLKSIGWKGRGFTCGGFLHQTADDIKYYPLWVDKLNLRAFFRLYKEPQLFKRYFILYPYAIMVILFDFLKYKFKK